MKYIIYKQCPPINFERYDSMCFRIYSFYTYNSTRLHQHFVGSTNDLICHFFTMQVVDYKASLLAFYILCPEEKSTLTVILSEFCLNL